MVECSGCGDIMPGLVIRTCQLKGRRMSVTRAGADQAPGLRERKKILTRDNLEETALRLFLEHGYDQARLEDICADALVSLRTFFRYYASKEDLVLGRLRAHLLQADLLFDARPSDETPRESVHAVIDHVVHDYVAEPRRERLRLRLVTRTPALETGLLKVFAGFERLVRSFVAGRVGVPSGERQARLLAAAAVGAFRVGLEMWIDDETVDNLPELIATNLDALTHGLNDAATG